ncbi:MAG: ATP synthase F0 subunit C [Candidatus Veblenbacteria bacterium]|nr:ATP synthase F0 subunit C [Candidatus Veblenbacteria bacterium]
MENELVQAVSGISAETIKSVAAGITIAIGGMFPALAIGRLAAKAMESIGRNPEASAKVQTAMILAIAFCEAIAIYALVMALIIKFV